MKSRKLFAAIPVLIAVAAMSACGGGGDDAAGSPTAFSIVPSEVTFTAPLPGTSVGTCPGGGTATIFIYGGTAPYRLDNTVPDVIALNTAMVGDRGGSFTITTLGGCVGPGNITVVDKLGNNVTLTVTTTPGA